MNALDSFNPVGQRGCAVLDCSGNLAVEVWVLLPTELYDGVRSLP